MSGLFGVGGGILFVPTLVALGLGQVEAAATSLLAVVPTAAVGTWRQARYGNLRARAGPRPRRRLDRRRRGRRRRSPRRCPSTSCGASSASCSSASPRSSRGAPPAAARATLRRRGTRLPPRGAGARRARRLDRGRRAASSPRRRATAVISRIVQPGLPDEVSLAAAAPPTSGRRHPGLRAIPTDGSIAADRLRRRPASPPSPAIVERAGRASARWPSRSSAARSRSSRSTSARAPPPDRRTPRRRLRLVDHGPLGARPAHHAVREPRHPARRLGHARGARLLGRDRRRSRRARRPPASPRSA